MATGKPLNKTQLEYAENRIKTKVRELRHERLLALGEEPKKDYTEKEKLELIRSGKAKLDDSKIGNSRRYGDTPTPFFTYPPLPPAVRNEHERWRKAYTKIDTELDAEQNRLLDRLYLLNSDEALSLLDEFLGKQP